MCMWWSVPPLHELSSSVILCEGGRTSNLMILSIQLVPWHEAMSVTAWKLLRMWCGQSYLLSRTGAISNCTHNSCVGTTAQYQAAQQKPECFQMLQKGSNKATTMILYLATIL